LLLLLLYSSEETACNKIKDRRRDGWGPTRTLQLLLHRNTPRHVLCSGSRSRRRGRETRANECRKLGEKTSKKNIQEKKPYERNWKSFWQSTGMTKMWKWMSKIKEIGWLRHALKCG
jgi:hypothetical protein